MLGLIKEARSALNVASFILPATDGGYPMKHWKKNPETRLAVNDVHVWVVPPECLAFADFWAILSPDEQHQTRRFRFERDQRAYFAAHVLTRLALSAFTPEVLPKGWRFENRSQGRPEIANTGFTGLLRFKCLGFDKH